MERTSLSHEAKTLERDVYGQRVKKTGEGRNPFAISLWLIGLVLLLVAAVLVHAHTSPWPVELQFTRAIQGPHPVPCPVPMKPHSWLEAVLFDISMINDPLFSVIIGAIWFVGLLLLRLFRQALYAVVAVASAGGLFLFFTSLVARPRPALASGICIHDTYPYYSFPSGHVIHDVVASGFLLYISLSEPVRNWRYRWLLIPFQLFFILDILLIGYSRLLQGDHWLFDVVGGYVSGALWLTLFIFLYRQTARFFTRTNVKRVVKHMTGR